MIPAIKHRAGKDAFHPAGKDAFHRVPNFPRRASEFL